MIFIYSPEGYIQCVLENDGSSKCPYWDVEIVEKLNGQLNLDFHIPSTHPDSKYIQPGAFVVLKDRNNKDYKLFQIIQLEGTYGQESQELSVTCEGAYYELGEHLIEKQGYIDAPIKDVVSGILGNSLWTLGYVDPAIQEKFSIAFTMQDALECLQQVLDKWKCEASYTVEVKDGKLAYRRVNLYKARGAYRGVKFTFDKNLSSVERTEDFADVKTRFYGVGRTLFTNKDGTYEWVDFQDMVWTTANGDPVDKPKGQTYVDNPDAIRRWGIRNGVYQEDTEDIKVLLEHTYKELRKHENPKLSYKLEAIDLEKQPGYSHIHVELGDTIVVTDLDLKINFGARVQEIRWSLDRPMEYDLTIGDFLELSTDKFLRIYQKYDELMKSVTKNRLDTSDAILTITKTINSLRLDMESESAQIHNYIDYNIEHLESVFSDKANDLSSRITQTNAYIGSEVSEIRSDMNSMKSELRTEISQTSSEIRLEVSKIEGNLENKADIDKLVTYINLSDQKIEEHALNINLDGFVTISTLADNGLELKGHTTIDGGVITGSEFKGGNVDTQNLHAHGEVYFYQSATVSQTLEVNGYLGFQTGQCAGVFNAGNMFVVDNLHAGTLDVTGTKHCAIPTEDYGTLLMNAFEFPEVMLGDIGWGHTNELGECVVSIDPKIQALVNTDIAYHVLITTNKGHTSSIEYSSTSFKVIADPNVKFSWVLIGKRRGYENLGFISKEQRDQKTKFGGSDTDILKIQTSLDINNNLLGV